MHHFLRKYLSSFQFWRYLLTLPLYYMNSMLPAIGLYCGVWIAEHPVMFYKLIGLIICMALLHLIFGKAAIYHQKVLYTSVHQAGMNLRTDLMKAMMKKREIPVDSSVQLNDVEKIEESLFLGGIELIEQILFYLLVFGIIFCLNPWIALFLMITSVLVSAVNSKSRKNGTFYQSQNSAEQKKQLDFLEQTESGYETILMYQQQERMEEQFHTNTMALCTAQGQLRWNQEKTQIVTMTFLLGSGMFTILAGGIFIKAQVLTLAQLLVIMQCSNYLFKPIQKIMTAWFQVQSVQGTVEKVNKILGYIDHERKVTDSCSLEKRDKILECEYLKEAQENVQEEVQEEAQKDIQEEAQEDIQEEAQKDVQKKAQNNIQKVVSEDILNKRKSEKQKRNDKTLQLNHTLKLNLSELSVNQKKILKGVSFTVEKGEKVLLLGANGCGKTTLLRYLMGHYGYQEESLWIDGTDCSRLPEEFVSTVFAPVDQNYFLLSGTVKENISCFRELSGQTEKEVTSLCHLEEILDRKEATKLSGGQMQRIAIARAVAAHHSIILLDEAFRAIDAENYIPIEQSLLQKPEFTVIEIAHRMTIETYQLFDKVILMDQGRIDKIGTPQQLLTEPFIQNLLGKESGENR